MTLCDDINAGDTDLSDVNLVAVLDYLDQAFKTAIFQKGAYSDRAVCG